MKKLLLILTVIIGVIYGLIILTNRSLVLFYGDTIEQLVPFYQHLKYLLIENPIIFWDTSNFLGASIYSYFFNAPLGSIFLYVSFLFDEKLVPYLFAYFDILRFFIVGIFSYLWLSKLSKNENSIIAVATMITFSGFMMNRIHYTPHIDAFMWIPLVLYSSENLLQEKKSGLLFIFSFFMVSFLSIYYTYMVTWFLILYLTFRTVVISYQKQQKFWISYKNNFLFFTRYYILAFGLASIFLIPEIYIVLTSPRVQSISVNLFVPFLRWQEYYSWFTSFISPVVNNFDSNLFISRSNETSLFFQYSFIIYPILLILLINDKRKLSRIYLIFFVFIQVAYFFPISEVVFNGTGNRWLFFLILINALIMLYILDNISTYSIKQIYRSAFLVILILIISFIFSKYYNLDTFNSQMLILHIPISIVFILLYTFYLTHPEFKYLSLLIVVLLICEGLYVLYSRMYTIQNSNYVKYSDYENYQLNKDNSAIFNYIKDNDKSFYRIDVEDAFGNHAMRFDYPGFVFYSSVYNSNMREFLDERFSNGWNVSYKPSRALIKPLFSSKYFIPSYETSHIPIGYEYLETFQGQPIYINKDYIELGFASTKTLSKENVDHLSSPLQDILMYQFIIDENSDNTLDEYASPEVLGEMLINDFISPPTEEGYLWIDFSETIPWSLCELNFYRKENIIIEHMSESNSLFIKNDPTIDMMFIYCSNTYNKNEFVPYDVYFLSNTFIKDLYTKVQNYDLFTNVKSLNNSYSADIDVTKADSTVFTSIPYDKGWKVYVDGEEIDIRSVNYGFIGFDLEEGSHHIDFKYSVFLLKEGIIVSLFSLLTILILKFKCKFL